MRKVVRRSRPGISLIRGAAGLVLGAPLALSLGGVAVGEPHANAAERPRPVQQTAARTDAAPIASQTPPAQPQFNAERYQSEVQRQLQLLYQQNSPPGGSAAAAPPNAGPPPGGSAGPRRLRMKDWWKPSAWKRQYHRWQRQRDQDRRQVAETNVPETQLGAPADVTLGGSAPQPLPTTAAAPNVTLPPAPVAATPAAPQARSAVASNAPSSVPAPAVPAVVVPRPQLQRVSPEIFAGPDSPQESQAVQAPAAHDAAPMFELGTAQSAPAEQLPRLLPTPAAAQPSPIEAPVAAPEVAETPQLFILPNPEPAIEIETAAVPDAPAAEPSPADVVVSAPAESSSDTGGFIAETAATPFDESPSGDDELLLGSETQAAVSQPDSAEPADLPPSGPFSGLELEANPFTESSPAAASGPAALNVPSPLQAPAVASEMLTAPADVPAPFTVPAESSLEAPVLPSVNTAASNTSTPAGLSAPQALAPEPQPAAAAPAALTPPATGRPLADAGASASRPDVQRKLSRIAERTGLTGFKGFCPVMLRDYRELVDAKLEHTLVYEGRQYWFSSAAARETFLLDPTAYVPARGGIDVVIFDRTGESRDGSLDHAVWYRGHLYLFDSEETRAAFAKSPLAHSMTQ